ncbi:hypothetical protein [Arthrobacter sp. UYEF3]|uniref:hypothetical protein n=1 Tax=Arthrobacter sp. UYEF3 TaxID=1756365 RepID=UPI003392B271
MIPFIMAGALFALAAARIPSLSRNGKDAVFMAGLFAGASCLLLAAPVYLAIDPVLGGVNLAKLVLNSFMIVGLWYLRTAVLSAVSPDPDTRPCWLRILPLSLALVLQTVFFVLAGLVSTTTAWEGDRSNRAATSLFALMMLCFIAWSCGHIAWACFRFVPRMRQSFRVGFSMVGLGCVFSVIVMTDMMLGELKGPFPSLDLDLGVPVREFELAAVVLVGIGLTIPPVAGHITRRRAARRLDRTVVKVSEIRDKALEGADPERTLKTTEHAAPQERLHRMIVEIWDAELSAGRDRSVLTPEDRDYMLLVEADFDTGKTY